MCISCVFHVYFIHTVPPDILDGSIGSVDWANLSTIIDMGNARTIMPQIEDNAATSLPTGIKNIIKKH